MQFLFPALILLVLILLAGFFAAAELGIMTLNLLKVQSEAQRGSRVAQIQLALRNRPQRFLSTILIGYNIANITFATYSAHLADTYLDPLLGKKLALTVATLIDVVLVTLFAELIPKTYAAVQSERLAAFAARPLYWLDWVLTPVNWLFEKFVSPILRLMTGGKAISVHHVPERGEVLTAVTMALSGGELHEVDARVAQEALRFSTIDLRDVMTPRVDVTGIEEQQTLGEALRLMRQTGYSRLPVYRETIDEVVGVVLIKDMISVLAAEADEGVAREWFHAKVADHIREVAYFPESKSVVDALGEIRTMRSHLAVVVDEHGGTAGIVTLEDILEELIGDIRDENDPDHSIDVVSSGEGWLIVTGRARVDSVPALARYAEDGEVDATSIGGLLMETLGRPAVVGDSVELEDGLKVSALKVHRNRIKLVRVEFPVEPEPAAELH